MVRVASNFLTFYFGFSLFDGKTEARGEQHSSTSTYVHQSVVLFIAPTATWVVARALALERAGGLAGLPSTIGRCGFVSVLCSVLYLMFNTRGHVFSSVSFFQKCGCGAAASWSWWMIVFLLIICFLLNWTRREDSRCYVIVMCSMCGIARNISEHSYIWHRAVRLRAPSELSLMWSKSYKMMDMKRSSSWCCYCLSCCGSAYILSQSGGSHTHSRRVYFF